MKRLATAFLLLALTAGADSLWSPGFDGYLGAGTRMQEGDTVMVTFTEGFSLSFKSVGTESKRITLQIAGGPYGDLLSFLPAASAEGNRSVAGDSQALLKGSLAARVSAVNGGMLTLQASRSLTVNGRVESVDLNASVNARDVSQNRTVDFSRLVEPRLVYRGPAEPSADAIRDEDLLALQAALAAAVPARRSPPRRRGRRGRRGPGGGDAAGARGRRSRAAASDPLPADRSPSARAAAPLPQPDRRYPVLIAAPAVTAGTGRRRAAGALRSSPNRCRRR